MRGIAWVFGGDGAPESDAIEELRRRILRASVQATGLGVASIAIYAFSVANPTGGVGGYFSEIFETFGVLTIVGGAAFLSAALLGFLFGVPKTLQGTAPGRSPLYKINTSFEEISDWLTKMIIGVGLVELKSIPSALMTLNDYVAWAVPQPGAAPVVGATVVFFGAAGLLVGYLSTRLYISRAFKDADEQLNPLEDALKNAAATLDRPPGGGASGVASPAASASPAGQSATSRADKGDTVKPPEAEDPRVQKVVEEAESANVDPRSLNRTAARRIATAYYLDEQYDAAIPYFEQAGAKSMSDPELALNYAFALGESGQRTRAAVFLRRMIDRDKGLPDAYKLLGYFTLWIPEKLSTSVEATNQYLERRPKDSGALFNLACAYAQLYGQHLKDPKGPEYRKDALAALRQAIELNSAQWGKRANELRIADFWALREDPDFNKLVDGS